MARPTKHRGKWRIRWIAADDTRRSEVYSERAVAVSMLRRRQLETEEVRKGLRQFEPVTKTFVELCEYWLEHRAPLKRSPKDDESIIRISLRPAFGELKVRDFQGEIGRTAIDKFFVERLAVRDKKTVVNYATLLISMLRLAHELEWLDRVPKIRKPRVRMFSRDYRYLRTTDEIARFLRKARTYSELAFTLYATAIYTGMRAGEIAALPWEDVDFDRRLITVQRSFDGPTKSDDVRYVPILNGLFEVLRAWRLRCPSPLVFPNEAGNMFGPSSRIYQETLKACLDGAGFPKVTIKGTERHYIRFHDLRHTFASHWVMRNGDLFRLQRVLGHKSIAMTQRYAHLAPELFVEDHDRIDARPLMSVSESNVVLVDFGQR